MGISQWSTLGWSYNQIRGQILGERKPSGPAKACKKIAEGMARGMVEEQFDNGGTDHTNKSQVNAERTSKCVPER
jgi:hypothetical protein